MEDVAKAPEYKRLVPHSGGSGHKRWRIKTLKDAYDDLGILHQRIDKLEILVSELLAENRDKEEEANV